MSYLRTVQHPQNLMRISFLMSFMLFISVQLSSQEIFLSTLNNLLYRLNLEDCSYDQIGVMPTSSTDISFHPNGNLYSVSSTGSLFEIDIANGTADLIHTLPVNSAQLFTALTISAEGIFYVCGLGGDLYRYDLMSDTGVFLGNVGFGAEGDLTFYEGELYMAAENDNIVLVDIDNPANSTVAINGSVPGRIFGVVSYAASCEEISVYALTDNAASVYEVNFEDETLDFFCSIPLQVSGGASTFEFLGSNPVFIDDVATTGFDCGLANGGISVQASGGVGALSFSLDGINYQAGNNFTDLALQEYTVYVQDEVGCVRTQVVTPDANVPTILELRITNTVCGESNGQIEVVVEGGVAPYEFYLKGMLSTTGLIAMGLSDGSYQFEIVDALGCSATTMANLGSIAPPVIDEVNIASTTCGEDNGSLTIEVVGGQSPLNYSINGGPVQANNTFANLPAGDYDIFVEDFAGCTVESSATILPSTQIAIDSITVTDARCGLANGTMSIAASGGAAPIEYVVNGLPSSALPFVTNLESGSYDVEVIDADGCTATATVTLEDSPALSLNVLDFTPSSCSDNNGELNVEATGGTGIISVTVNGQITAKPESITGLAPGSYTIVAEDEFGCTAALQVDIPAENCPVYVPNVFSPNRDGVNDFFAPLSSGVANVEVERFIVFDRWGGVVFEQASGLLGDSKFQWDGRKNGDLLVQGVYIYILELRYANEERVQLSGDVMLMW